MQFLRTLYGLLLYLFPGTYREEYGDELQAVFILSFDDAMRNGRGSVLGLLFHEMIGLPQAILYEHLRERRKMISTLSLTPAHMPVIIMYCGFHAW